MKKLSTVLLVSLMVLTSACVKNDDASYTGDSVNATPLAETEVTFVYETTENESGSLEEKVVFTPFSLADTINMTLKRHHGLKIILSNLKTAELNVKGAKAGWGPRVDLRSDYGFDHQQDGTISGKQETGMHPGGSANLVLTQPLWDGFATRNRVGAGTATVDSLTARVFDNVTTFALDAIIAHVDVNRRRAIAVLAQENIDSHEEVLASQRARVASGAAAASDVTQAQGRLLRVRASFAQNIELLRAAESQYHRLTGVYPPVGLEVVELPENLYNDPQTAFRQASLTNPKVEAFLYDVDAAKFNVGVAKANYQPKVDLEIGSSYSDRDPEGFDTDYQVSFDTRIRMNWNLFNSFADVNAVRAANSRTVESRQTVLNLLDELENEINTTYAQYYSAISQREFYEQAKVYNNETRMAYLEQFDVGMRSLSDILDAESEFFSSSTEELTASGNIIVGAYRILALSGELMDTLSIEAEDFYSMNIEDVIGK